MIQLWSTSREKHKDSAVIDVSRLCLSTSPIRNDTGVFVSDIVKGGLVDTDGQLMQGDQILSVNGEDVRSTTQEAVAALLKVRLYRTGPEKETQLVNDT